MSRKDSSALDDVDLVLSGAMSERVVFRATYSGRKIVRAWCMVKEDAIMKELMREFSEMTIEKTLIKLGYFEEQIPHVLNVLSKLFTNLKEA
ncbi:MAG: hypothetical protein QXL77_06635 [Candidatus Bathyarchaeia archaeon]